MKGFDLYEQWRSCVYQVSNFVAPSWDALEIWERRAWEELQDRVTHDCVSDPDDDELSRSLCR